MCFSAYVGLIVVNTDAVPKKGKYGYSLCILAANVCVCVCCVPPNGCVYSKLVRDAYACHHTARLPCLARMHQSIDGNRVVCTAYKRRAPSTSIPVDLLSVGPFDSAMTATLSLCMIAHTTIGEYGDSCQTIKSPNRHTHSVIGHTVHNCGGTVTIDSVANDRRKCAIISDANETAEITAVIRKWHQMDASCGFVQRALTLNTRTQRLQWRMKRMK